jgi:hypothetical protein
MLIVAAIFGMIGTGPWFDEIYTLYFSQPGQTFVQGWNHDWWLDNHPPLYYGLSWATNWLGPDVEARRLLNLPILLAGLFGAALFAVRNPGHRLTLMLMGISLASIRVVLDSAADLRSTFLSIVAATLTTVALSVYSTPQSRHRWSWTALAALTLPMTLAFNLHYVHALVMAVVVGSFLVWLCLANAWLLFGRLALAGTIAGLPLLTSLLTQGQDIELRTRVFWIPSGYRFAFHQVYDAIGPALVANPVLFVTGTTGAILLLIANWRHRRIDPNLALILTLGAACSITVALLLAIHSIRPIVVDRYFYPLLPAIALAMAAGTRALQERSRNGRAR